MDRGSRSVRAAWVLGFAVLSLAVGAGPARAAFPGRNGVLVVVPARGNGLILVGADGAHLRRICGLPTLCAGATDPVWSPDGSEIAFGSSDATNGVIYGDGSCFACPVPGPWVDGADDASWGLFEGFLPDGRLAVSIDNQDRRATQWGAVNPDGIGYRPFRISGPWRQPAWSSTGQLAAVRRVKHKSEVFEIELGTGSARRLTLNGAAAPNWSPDGRRLAVVHRGWIELIGSHGGRVRRLIRGGAPAWAPDGKELAFVGARRRVFVISVRGGRPNPVGRVRAQWVDWQPVTGRPHSPCQTPAGSSVVAASPDATVSIDPAPVGQQPDSDASAFSVLGCLNSDGHERVLESMPPPNVDNAYGVGAVAFAGDYAAIVNEGADPHYGGMSQTVAVIDLRTGTAVANRGGETAGCPDYDGYGCNSGVDQLVLGSDGVTAAHTFVSNYSSNSAFTTTEEIVANDSAGTHILDSIATTGPYDPTPSMLSHLALSGDTLTWSHDGTSETAQLH